MFYIRNYAAIVLESFFFFFSLIGKNYLYSAIEIRNFLKLLLDKKRFDIFLDVAEYLRTKYSHQGQVDVLLKTAFPLELELIKRIETVLKNKFKQNLRFYIDLDGSLLGGVQVVIGNTIIDGSVQKRLQELREKLNTIRMD